MNSPLRPRSRIARRLRRSSWSRFVTRAAVVVLVVALVGATLGAGATTGPVPDVPQYAPFGTVWEWSDSTPEIDGVRALVPTSDGGVLVVGYAYVASETDDENVDAVVRKLDADGQLEWSRQFGGNREGTLTLRGVVERDDEYLLVGDVYGSPEEEASVWFVTVGHDGTDRGQTTYRDSFADYTRAVETTADGGFVVVGTTQSTSNLATSDVLLLKYDADGALEWRRTLGSAGVDERGRDVVVLEDGYAVLGETRAVDGEPDNVLLVRTDTDGQPVWTNRYGTSGGDYAFNVEHGHDDTLLVVSRTVYSGDEADHALVLGISLDGTLEFSETEYYTGPGGDALLGGTATPDGYVVVGCRFDAGFDAWSGWVVTLDADGQAIGESTGERGCLWSATTLADGSVVVGGHGYDPDGDVQDPLVLRLSRDVPVAEGDVSGSNDERADGDSSESDDATTSTTFPGFGVVAAVVAVAVAVAVLRRRR